MFVFICRAVDSEGSVYTQLTDSSIVFIFPLDMRKRILINMMFVFDIIV